jgi:hypothetical protein
MCSHSYSSCYLIHKLDDFCRKCGGRNTLERDKEGDLHCWACGTDQEGKNPDGAKGAEKLTPGQTKEHMNHQQIMERHKFYEDNKQSILADVQSIGRPATCRKWSIPSGSLSLLLDRWKTKSKSPEYKRHRQGINVHERSKYYENNKEAIIADLLSIGRKAACQKWGITSSSLLNLEQKWLTPEQKAAIHRYRKHDSPDRPIFSLISLIDPSMTDYCRNYQTK